MHMLMAISLFLASVQSAATTQFVTSKDGTKIAYDVTGSGPAIILLHGGGQERKSWHRAGYVARLAKEFTVVTLDIRGNGESDKPGPVSAYSWERINEDILSVADAIKAPRFALWGFFVRRERRPLSRVAVRSRDVDGLHWHPVRPSRR